MRKKEEDSSLELLLDTMCNTFGGIMFIAITLVVILTQKLSQRQNSPAEEIAQSKTEILAQINVLRKRLTEQTARKREMHQAKLILEKDPRLKSLKQIAALEELIKNEKTRQALLGKELQFFNMEIQKKEGKLQKMTEEEMQQRQAILALSSEIDTLRNNLAALQLSLQKYSPLTLSFTLLETRNDLTPYFLLLSKGKIWRIGPDVDASAPGGTLPSDDVDATTQGNIVKCTPKADAGVPALTGDLLSSECLDLLRAIPKNRVPAFRFGQEDAAVFYKMRELLKQQNIFHGFHIVQQTDEFEYEFVQKASYEY